MNYCLIVGLERILKLIELLKISEEIAKIGVAQKVPTRGVLQVELYCLLYHLKRLFDVLSPLFSAVL